MPTTTSKYLKLGLILSVPIVIGLLWRGFMSLFTSTGGVDKTLDEELQDEVMFVAGDEPTTALPQLGGSTSTRSNKDSITIAVPDRFDVSTMSNTEQSLKSDKIIIQWYVLTGLEYHKTVMGMILSGTVDLALLSSDTANDCGAGCAYKFDYRQPIEAFVLNPVSDAIRDAYWTMIPYGLDPMVTFHGPNHQVRGSRSALLNDLLISSSESKVAGSLPLAIGVGAADKALLRAGQESFPGYAEIVHQLMIQFSNNETLLSQLLQLADSADLWSLPRMRKSIETLTSKFPVCKETVSACLVRFTVSYYGFGYLTDRMRLPDSWSKTLLYDQFPIETSYYPMRLWGFIVPKASSISNDTIGRFIAAYVSDMINVMPDSAKSDTQLLSPFSARYEAQGYDPQYQNIMRYTDMIRIQHGGSQTALDRARKGGLMSVLERRSSIQVYLSQQEIY